MINAHELPSVMQTYIGMLRLAKFYFPRLADDGECPLIILIGNTVIFPKQCKFSRDSIPMRPISHNLMIA